MSSHCLPSLLDTWPLRYQVPPDQLALVPEVSGHVFEAAVGDPVPIQAGPEVRAVSYASRRARRCGSVSLLTAYPPYCHPSQGFSGPAPVYLALVDVGAAGPGGGNDFLDLVCDRWNGSGEFTGRGVYEVKSE